MAHEENDEKIQSIWISLEESKEIEVCLFFSSQFLGYYVGAKLVSSSL